MTDKYEIEVLLRPPVELHSSIVSGLSAYVMLSLPEQLMMTQSTAYTSAALLTWFSVYRAKQALSIIRYHNNLKRTPRYYLSSNQIPISNQGLFVGRGFLWTQKHTERIYAARDRNAEKYTRPNATIQWLRRKEIEWERTYLRHITKLTAADNVLNLVRPPPKTGGDPIIHGVGYGDEQDVYLPLSERPGHTAVVARTRHGKTRLAETLITQDIHREEKNCVVVFDPKGDADLLKRTYVEAKKAKRKMIIVHLGHPEMSARYNAIGSFSRITEPASRLANGIPGEGDGRAFKDFAWQFVNTINVALFKLGEQPDYLKIRRYISDIDPLFVRYSLYWLEKNGPADWEKQLGLAESHINSNKLSRAEQGREIKAVALARYIRQIDVFDPVIEGLISAFRFEREYFQKITGAVKPLLEKLTTGKIAEVLSPNLTDIDDNRPVLDWLEAIRTNAVVFVALDALTDPEVAEVFGQSAFSDLTSLAGHIYKHGVYDGLPELGGNNEKTKVIIHGDEFSDLLGPQFKTLINKSGGAGYILNLYTQTWSDVIAELGDVAKAGQVAGNIGTVIMMGVKEISTCEMLTKQLPEVNVSEVTAVSSVTDASSLSEGVTFVSQNQDRISVSRVPMIGPADIVALPKGQAFMLINGSELWKIRIPLPTKADDKELPDDLTSMLNEMQQSYRSNQDYSFTDSIDFSVFH
jgi:conjugative coupling factor TraD (TOL family)